MRDITMCHPRLQLLAARLAEECKKQGLIIGIGESFRTVEEQNALYAQGRTAPGSIVTNAKGSSYSSQHQWGIAFDFFRNDGKGAYNEAGGFFEKVGAIGKQLGLGWGGDWKSIVDRPHLYLPDWGSTTAQLRQLYSTPERFSAVWDDFGDELVTGPSVAAGERAAWEKDSQGRYKYRKESGQYAVSEWLLIHGRWYLFGADGVMLTGWQKWNGRRVVTGGDVLQDGGEASGGGQGDWYYLDETPGGALEGACWHERDDRKGAMEIWEVS